MDEDLNYLIEIDGGVSLKNIGKLAKAGTEILVAGSSVFKTDNIPSRIKELSDKAEKGHAKIA